MDLTTAVAVIAVLVGSAGLAGVIKVFIDGKANAKQHELDKQQAELDRLQTQIDSLIQIITQVKDENRRLIDRQAAYEQLREKDRQRIAELEEQQQTQK